ncbi:TPA: hypothetical protein I7730_14155 [Vibrio vulnificus]|uniref:Uncharacterized protein n=1 Tax=Vibrio vulnificus TaxID=672 RepID=A0A8H9N171_VIBVL|nr:hypothetical protein [Vibrio vulnificus]HAS8540929.1 hypothetical protein [Vibrio vulnificus]
MSTLLSILALSLLGGPFEPNTEDLRAIQSYKHEYLHTSYYKKCASKNWETKILGSPLRCMDTNYLEFVIGQFMKESDYKRTIHTPYNSYIATYYHIDGGPISEISVITNRRKQVMLLSTTYKLPLGEESEAKKNIRKSIEDTYGAPHGYPKSKRSEIQEWSWTTSDHYDIRFKTDTTSAKVTFIDRQAYETLEQIAPELK